MRLYLDLNCFNRPFDDQSQTRIARETTAVFDILERVEQGLDELVWSTVLSFENSRHPLADRRHEIGCWVHRAVSRISVTREVSERAGELVAEGFRALDAAHLALAETASVSPVLNM